MQTSIASNAAHGVQHLPLRRLIAAACATVALAGAAAASPAAAPASTYRIVPLTPDGFVAGINAKGQVAYTVYEGDNTRARFYDGALVRDLGTFGGSSAIARALNVHGQVAGMASTRDGSFHAFRWGRRSGLVDLNPAGIPGSGATDINDKGQVVGSALFSGTTTAFRWSPHTGMVNLGSLGPTSASEALAINDAGTAVGWSEDASEDTRRTQATMWPPGGRPTPLSNFPSDLASASDINNAGQIVGSAAFDASLSDQAFIWTRQGGLQGLGTPSAAFSHIERINEKGLAIGGLFTGPGERDGFIWSRGDGMLVIGTPPVDESVVFDVNNRGQVVGALNGRAFIWTRAGGLVDLNSLVSGAPPEFQLYSANTISDNGTIAAHSAAGLVLLVPDTASRQPPVAGPVRLTGTARVNALLSFSASFKDVDVRDTHTAAWSWGDGSKTVGTVSESKGTGSVSAQHAYRAAGVYTVRLTLTDSSGKSSTVERKLVVCATRTATSGAGAFVGPAAAAGIGKRRASFGSFAFLSEGAAARKAVVQVNVDGMALRSSQVETVAADDTRVQYSGRGTVNGRGNYRFTLTATKGAGTGGKDRIHVRITHTEPGSTVEKIDYDNGAGAGAQAKAAGATAAGAEGSVVIGGRMIFGGQ